MFASYVPLTSGGPTRATVAAGIAHVRAGVGPSVRVKLMSQSVFQHQQHTVTYT